MEADVTDFPLLEKLHNKITKRLRFFKANECLNVLRAINQTVKLEMAHEAFFKECVNGLPLESLSDLSLNKLTALSINYHLIKNNKRLPFIQNKELEAVLEQNFLLKHQELAQMIADKNFNESVATASQVAHLQDKG